MRRSQKHRHLKLTSHVYREDPVGLLVCHLINLMQRNRWLLTESLLRSKATHHLMWSQAYFFFFPERSRLTPTRGSNHSVQRYNGALLSQIYTNTRVRVAFTATKRNFHHHWGTTQCNTRIESLSAEGQHNLMHIFMWWCVYQVRRKTTPFNVSPRGTPFHHSSI